MNNNNTNFNQNNYGQLGYPINYGQPLNTKKKGMSTGNIVGIVIGIVCICINIILTFILSLAAIGILLKNIDTSAVYNDSVSEDSGTKTDSIYGKIITFGDGSTLYFNKDGTYSWYKDDFVKDDNYFEGTFVAVSGVDAKVKIVNELSSYGITADELEQFCEANEDNGYTQDNLICIVMTCSKRIVDKKDVTKANDTISYMGFYDGENYTLANMDTRTYLTIESVEDQQRNFY